MLSNSSAEQGSNAAQILGVRDIGLRAKEGSPLAQLVALSQIGPMVDASNEGSDNNPELHASFMMMNTEKNPEFEAAMTYARDNLARDVTAHISFAKNTVVPAVEALERYVTAEVERVVNSQSLDYRIECRELPEPLYNTSLRSTIEKEATGSTLMPETQVRLRVLAPQEIYELMLAGSSTFDEQVRLWISKCGDGFFHRVYGSLFSDEAGDTVETSKSWNELLDDRLCGADAALAVFLLAQRLEKEVPEGVQMPLADYETILAQYRKAAVERMAREIVAHDANQETGLMVFEYDQRRRVVVVNGDVYRQWLDTGGKPEVLGGAMVAGNGGFTVAMIEERRAEYESLLERHLTMQSTVLRNDSFMIFRRALREGFATSMLNLTNEESEMAAQSQYRATAEENFERELNMLRADSMECVSDTCLAVLCRSRFYYTDAEKFLCAMKAAAKANGKIAPREAALIATIQYVAEYIAQQMDVV